MSNDVENYSVTAASNIADWPEGQAPSTVNDAGRESQADVARLLTRLEGNCTVGGTANAITLTFSPVLTAHRDKRPIVFRATDTNTDAMTCVVDSLASYAITKDGGTALAGGEIQAGGVYLLHTDTGNTNFELMNPAVALNAGGLTDTNGNEAVTVVTTTGAVNELTVTPSATGNAVDVSATGGDTDIDITITPKGAGELYSTTASANEIIKQQVFS